jgi:hypothetical protein
MLGFKSPESAARFCRAFEEQREHFRFRRHHNHQVSLPLQRVHILGKFADLKEKFKNRKLIWVSFQKVGVNFAKSLLHEFNLK